MKISFFALNLWFVMGFRSKPDGNGRKKMIVRHRKIGEIKSQNQKAERRPIHLVEIPPSARTVSLTSLIDVSSVRHFH